MKKKPDIAYSLDYKSIIVEMQFGDKIYLGHCMVLFTKARAILVTKCKSR